MTSFSPNLKITVMQATKLYCKCVSNICHSLCFVRDYSNRNILQLHERGMFQDLYPSNSSAGRGGSDVTVVNDGNINLILSHSQEVLDLLNTGPQCVYAGFDPTADSLHIGNLLVLINLLHWQRSGHNVVALVGGATGQIGDPSGRCMERPELAEVFVADNTLAIQKTIEQIFDNHQNIFWKEQVATKPLPAIKLVNNYHWYRNMNAVEFVSRVGCHFRMGTMLSRHSVQARLTSETGMSLAEFCYQVFQSYDWLHLLKKHNCRFQIGGSDQMGNIMSGQDLISRVSNINVYGLTVPLITTESGNKFGKSAGNAVWLDANKTSPFELYQFFIRTRDSDIETLLKLFTFEKLGSIHELMKKHESKPEARLAQKKLAEQVTLLVHGEKGLNAAQQATAVLYDSNLKSLGQLTVKDIAQVFQGATSCELLLEPGITILQLALRVGCFATESDAKRIITAGGFYINHHRITNIDEVLTQTVHILPNNVTLIRVGKKNYYIVKWLT